MPILLLVVQAGSTLRAFLGAGEGGEEHGCQNRDDRDDDQQLNQSKRTMTTRKLKAFFLG